MPWFVRVVKAAHQWTLSESVFTAAFAIIGLTTLTAFVATYATFAFIELAIFVASVAGLAAGLAAFVAAGLAAFISPGPYSGFIMVPPPLSEKGARTFYYAFLTELGMIAIVGSGFGHPMVSSIPFTVGFAIWFVNGIRRASGG